MDISTKHQNLKFNGYWDDLVGGNTGQYKEAVIDRLLQEKRDVPSAKLLDIGCGTCDLLFKYYKNLKSESVSFVDYDEQIIQSMKQNYPQDYAFWYVQDIFKLKDWKESFDLVFMLDMLHEIYSFYGRFNRDVTLSVDHDLGMKFVKEALSNIVTLLNPKGGIIITDNVLCEENQMIKVKVRTDKVKQAIQYFVENYPSRIFNIQIDEDNVFEVNSRDFCILLTQYNKIKRGDLDRFQIERMEIHQYMTLKEYEEIFVSFGMKTDVVIGTPTDAKEEWNQDFEIVEGLDAMPEKRVTLLAQKK